MCKPLALGEVRVEQVAGVRCVTPCWSGSGGGAGGGPRAGGRQTAGGRGRVQRAGRRSH